MNLVDLRLDFGSAFERSHLLGLAVRLQLPKKWGDFWLHAHAGSLYVWCNLDYLLRRKLYNYWPCFFAGRSRPGEFPPGGIAGLSVDSWFVYFNIEVANRR